MGFTHAAVERHGSRSSYHADQQASRPPASPGTEDQRQRNSLAPPDAMGRGTALQYCQNKAPE